MCGFVTEQEAAEKGFTHHGKYYGLPVWIAPDGPDGAVVEPKCRIFGWMIGAICYLEIIFRIIMYPRHEPVFQITTIKPIGRKDESTMQRQPDIFRHRART